MTNTDPTGLDASEFYNSLGKPGSDSSSSAYEQAVMHSLGSSYYQTGTPSESAYPSAPDAVVPEVVESPLEYNYYNNNLFVDTNKRGSVNLFINDKSSMIHTFGLSASGTVAITSGAAGVGVYVNPKNEFLFSISMKLLGSTNSAVKMVGLATVIANIEDMGVYIESAAGGGLSSSSGSLGISVGEYENFQAAQGPYAEKGFSGGPAGISFGIDSIKNLKGEKIGNSISLGIGGGTAPAEFHWRFGVTGIFSLKCNRGYNNDK